MSSIYNPHFHISRHKRHIPQRLERELTRRFTVGRWQWLPRACPANRRDSAGRAAQPPDNPAVLALLAPAALLPPIAREVNNQQPMITQLLLTSWHGLAWKMCFNCLITAGSSTATTWTSLWQTALKLLARNYHQCLSFLSLPLIPSYQNENVSSSFEKAVAKTVGPEQASFKDFL